MGQMARVAGCPLCEEAGGVELASAADMRVIRANEAAFPAFYRVVWTDHVAEFSDLTDEQRNRCMAVVVAVERALRDTLSPQNMPEIALEKVNLAALGNVVPHLHWHVIARHSWDSHFPAPVWAQATREADPLRLGLLNEALPALDAAVKTAVLPLGLAPAVAI